MRIGKYFKAVRLAALLVLVMAALTSCDAQDQQDEFAEQARRTPKGITERTLDGETLAEDPDDWRTAPFYRGLVRVDPAYPNPASIELVTVPVTVTQFDAVRGGLTLRAFDASGQNFISLGQLLDAVDPGAYNFSFSPGLLGTKGLHRLYVFDFNSEIVSYGDLLIQ